MVEQTILDKVLQSQRPKEPFIVTMTRPVTTVIRAVVALCGFFLAFIFIFAFVGGVIGVIWFFAYKVFNFLGWL